MRNDHEVSARFGTPAVAAVSENPAHAIGASVSEVAALVDAVQLLLIRAESLLVAAESCRCCPVVPDVLVPVHKGMI